MIELVLRFFGVKVEDVAHLTGASVSFQNRSGLGWMIFLGVLLVALSWWTYAHTEKALPPLRRRLLTVLRSALFLLILLALLRPILSFTIEGSVRRMLVVLVDTSTSMKIQDPRLDAADIKRAAIGKGLIRNLNQTLDAKQISEVKQISRVELLKAVLLEPGLRLLPKFHAAYDMSVFGFGQNVAPLIAPAESDKADKSDKPGVANQDPWVKAIIPKSPQTAIGDAIREVISTKRGQPLAGIFLATDGANNSGSPAAEAANFARQEGVPLYIYGVGIASPRDIIVGDLFTQDIAFVKDEVPVTVRVKGQGMKGQSAELILKLGENQVASKELNFTGDEEVVVPLTFTPTTTGEFELQASIQPRDDEVEKENNSTSQRIRVIDSKIKVLLVEQSPRWEFRYLHGILSRDRRVDLKCFLVEGDPAIAEGEESPYVAEFPANKEALFKYDLLILGDVDAKTFLPAQLDNISDFASKFGGACIFLAGKKSNPASYKGTPLENMLPVEIDSISGESTRRGGEKPLKLEVTPLGRTNPMLRLSPREDENASIWRKFPPIYWENRVPRAKPAAQVLLVDPDPARESRSGKMPVMALQQFGLGQTLYIGTDSLWRWRMNAGEQYHTLFWSQVTQKMALVHLLGGSKRTQLTVDKQQYTVGERVGVYARLYTESFEPVREPTMDAAYSVKALPGKPEVPGEKQDVQLRAVPDQQGMFRGEFVAATPGVYQFNVKNDPKVTIEFTVTEPRFEVGETAMNEALLKQMATASGGEFFREEDLGRLADMMKLKTEAVRNVVDSELWASPFYFLLMVGLGTAEWILRKRSELK